MKKNIENKMLVRLAKLELLKIEEALKDNMLLQFDSIEELGEYCKKIEKKYNLSFYISDNKIEITYKDFSFCFLLIFFENKIYTVDFEKLFEDENYIKNYFYKTNLKKELNKITEKVYHYTNYYSDFLFFEDEKEISKYCEKFNEEFKRFRYKLENNEKELYITFSSEKYWFSFEYKFFFTNECYIIPDFHKILYKMR